MFPEDLTFGRLVMFKSELDWYRGIVVKQKTGMVRLFCPDFGWTSKMVPVSSDLLQPLDEQSRRSKFWGSPCSLVGQEDGVKKEGDILRLSVVRVDGLKYIVKNM